MKKRIASWMAVLMIFTLIGGAAHAEETTTTVEAGVTNVTGIRYIQAAPALVLSPLSGNFAGPMAVTVEEVAASGSKWRLTAQAGPFISGANQIGANSLTLAASTVAQTLGGGSAGNQGSGTMDTTRTLYEVTGQDPALAYSGLYVSSSPLTLKVPNGTPLGTYTSTVTITLSTF
ncbi:MAG: hypothetical protein KY429_04965 [Actinobacteria bacterium]|nr:hypothetical protein [Actinomycetota bacterium]